jgi:hypothetical protein
VAKVGGLLVLTMMLKLVTGEFTPSVMVTSI